MMFETRTNAKAEEGIADLLNNNVKLGFRTALQKMPSAACRRKRTQIQPREELTICQRQLTQFSKAMACLPVRNESIMFSSTQDLLAHHLHHANSRLRFWLERLGSDPACATPATPQEMSGLLSELLRAGEWLRAGLPEEREPGLEIELDEYRRNVSRLRELLPSIHSQLLKERARLEDERRRITSATPWVQGTRQTL